MSRSLKLMARGLGVPVLVASQLSRRHAQEKRPPALHDLRDSGAIEQDADLVIATYRPDSKKDLAELKVLKQRNGVIGTCRVRFDGTRMLFRSVNGGAYV